MSIRSCGRATWAFMAIRASRDTTTTPSPSGNGARLPPDGNGQTSHQGVFNFTFIEGAQNAA